MSLPAGTFSYFTKYYCLLAMLLTAGLNSKAAAWADVQDSLSLLQFQRQVLVLGWPALWDTTQNVRQWHGVGLEPVTGKVVSIIIKGEDIGNFTTDALPSCIQTMHTLDSLKEIYFINLGLKELCPEIGGFKDLTTLGLQRNNLFALPKEVAQLTSLQHLFLSSNKIMELPDLSALQQLNYLSLSANRQLPEIPATVFSLLNLQQLDIGYTAVTSIPEEIKILTKLEQFRANAAGIDSISPAVGNLLNLTSLQLAGNNLTSLPESLGCLTNLTELDISRNQLTELPESFDKLVNLLGIGFSDNLLDSFPIQLVRLPKLLNINGRENRMKGTVPAGLFAKKGLRLYLEGNELSGKLEIQSNNIPARLYIKENRFTLKDIIEHYNLFNPANNTYIEFQPQKKIGTGRTYYPESNSNFAIEIDNYFSAEGCTFTWLRSPHSNQDNSIFVSSNQVLEFKDFNRQTDGGNYYCIVKHPDVPDLSLKSNTVRIIGTDKDPAVTCNDVLFRLDSIATITVRAIDDYTPVDSLIYNFPVETAHFLIEPYWNSYHRQIKPKNNTWTGTDTLLVSVTDENGNATHVFAPITVLPVENTPPVVHIPDIYMSFYQYYVPPCEPGTEGCDQQYILECYTYLEHFVKDDFTSFDRMEFSILEVDASGQYTGSDKIHAYVNETMDGTHLDVYVFANCDTTFTLTLQVTDCEGGVSQQSIQFIARISVPNENPVTIAVPAQIIYKGATQFAALNLNDYVKDDYLSDSVLVWRGGGSLLLDIKINDSIAEVSPRYADSVFTTTYTYYVYEKTNDCQYNSVDVTYTVMELPEISGTITDTAGLPLQNVKLLGFPETTYTDSHGRYTAQVTGGWSGSVYPEMELYSFSPDTVRYTNVSSDITGQDFTGYASMPATYTLRFAITDGNSPVENARVDFDRSTYTTDRSGLVTITDVANGTYSYTIVKTGFEVINDMLTITGSDTTVSVVLSLLTYLNESPYLKGIVSYPNPVKNVLTIEIPESIEVNTVKIFTVKGHFKEQIPNSGSGIIYLDVSRYSSGIYFIKLFDQHGNLTLKILKE